VQNLYSKGRKADVVELVDTTDLNKHLSAAVETLRVELLKNGETFNMAIPCQALSNYEGRCRDLTGSTYGLTQAMVKGKSSPQTPTLAVTKVVVGMKIC
jgi:hypothetical protein